MRKPKDHQKSKGPSWIKPGFVVAAITFAWAAANTPPDFSPTSLAIWATGTLTAGLIAKAAMAVITPFINAIIRIAQQQMHEAQHPHKPPQKPAGKAS